MQPQGMSRKKALLLLGIGFAILICIAWLITALTRSDENQFGRFIRIQNYDSKVKNLADEMRDAMETSLYNTVDRNMDDSKNPLRVNDAYIRENSEEQTLNRSTGVYSGRFIIDMESIKQSYQVQYSYVEVKNSSTSGSPVIITCLPSDQLKYGDFGCTDIASEQTSKDDLILQYLPYRNFSFEILPDSTQGDKLVLHTTLKIPQSDLRGNTASRLEVISMYKAEVTGWISSKGLNPEDYDIRYNYDDAGNIIPENHHGD